MGLLIDILGTIVVGIILWKVGKWALLHSLSCLGAVISFLAIPIVFVLFIFWIF